MRAVAEAQHRLVDPGRQRAPRAEVERFRPDSLGVGVGLPHAQVDQVPGSHGPGTAGLGDVERALNAPVQMPDHGLQPNDLVQDREALRLSGREVPLPQWLVAEQVPGGHRHELARGDHAGRAVRDALHQDVGVAVALGDEVADDVLARLLPAGPDGRTDVGEVEPHDRRQPVDRRLGPLSPRPSEIGTGQIERGLVEEADEPGRHPPHRRVGEPHHVCGHFHGVEQRQVLELEGSLCRRLVQEVVGARLHVGGVALGDHRGGEEASHLAALLVVQWPVADQDRVVLEIPLGDGLGGEPGLRGQGAGAQDLPRRGQRTDPPHVAVTLHARDGRLPRLVGSAQGRFVVHRSALPLGPLTKG